jgi:hypothetical protein
VISFPFFLLLFDLIQFIFVVHGCSYLMVE